VASIPIDAGEGEEERLLWRRLLSDQDTAARAALFVRHVPFAQTMARRRHRERTRGDLELADLMQQASSALLEAIDRFDPERGVPFRAYAARRIAGSMSDAITASSEHREQLSVRARAHRARIRSLAPDGPGPATPQAALAALTDLAVGLALGFMLEDADIVEDDAGTDGHAYRSAAWREIVDQLLDAIETLPEREHLIVREHYLRGVAFETLAGVLGLSKGRISQLHHSALLTLKRRLARRGHFSLKR
jgi:RNA polymerase sigma factor FliA